MSDKFTDSEIIKLLEVFVGPVEAVGETNADKVYLNNLMTLIDITNWCLDTIAFAATFINRKEKSMFDIGWTARCALEQYYSWLGDLTK